MDDRDAVLRDARPVLARMELLSYGTVQRMGSRRGAETNGRPPGEDHPMHEIWARLLRETRDAKSARTVLQRACDALDAALRRRLVPDTVETLDELCARIVSDGWGIGADECAIAMRCTPTLVRRARLDAGRHPETGADLPPARADRMTWARELDDAGLSLRQIERLTGVSKDTVRRRR